MFALYLPMPSQYHKQLSTVLLLVSGFPEAVWVFLEFGYSLDLVGLWVIWAWLLWAPFLGCLVAWDFSGLVVRQERDGKWGCMGLIILSGVSVTSTAGSFDIWLSWKKYSCVESQEKKSRRESCGRIRLHCKGPVRRWRSSWRRPVKWAVNPLLSSIR